MADGSDPRHDDWPIEDREEYADVDVHRAPPDDATDEVAEEYERELAEEDVEVIGGTGGSGLYVYSRPDAAVYEGDLDSEEERVVLREAARHDVDEHSLGDAIEDLGEKHDWDWLSSFAHEHLGADDDGATFEHRTSEFHRQNVAETDPYDLAFYGSHVFEDPTGRVRTIDREFDVYLDGDAVDRVEVAERHLRSEGPEADRRAGDADIVAERERRLDPSVTVGDTGGEAVLEERLEEWHADNADLRLE